MNEFKGTPVPWRLHVEPGQVKTPTLTDADHYMEEYVAVVGADGGVVCDNADYYPKEICKADAVLMVSTSRLLAALQELEEAARQVMAGEMEVSSLQVERMKAQEAIAEALSIATSNPN